MKTPNLVVRQKGDLVFIDMAGITDLSHAGLQELLTECAAVADAGKLKFLNVNKRVKARLKKVGMYNVFATREEWALTMGSAPASAGTLRAPGSEYFFG